MIALWVQALLQTRIDEVVELAVEHGLRVTLLDVSA
jgi:hypothetical protein